MKNDPRNLSAYPGGAMVSQGLNDLRSGVKSENALVVSMAASRLRDLGLVVESPIFDAELMLYNHLAELHADNAHSRFNALRRQLVSFQRAWACVS